MAPSRNESYRPAFCLAFLLKGKVEGHILLPQLGQHLNYSSCRPEGWEGSLRVSSHKPCFIGLIFKGKCVSKLFIKIAASGSNVAFDAGFVSCRPHSTLAVELEKWGQVHGAWRGEPHESCQTSSGVGNLGSEPTRLGSYFNSLGELRNSDRLRLLERQVGSQCLSSELVSQL